MVIRATLLLAHGSAADRLAELELRWLENLLAIAAVPFTHTGVVVSGLPILETSYRVPANASTTKLAEMRAFLTATTLDALAITGYDHVEFTHAAAAAYVASGMADVSLGVEAVARQFDLDFVRLVKEDYFFVCRKQILEHDAMKQVLAIMRGQEFQEAISRLAGYKSSDAGAIKTIKDAFQPNT